MHQARHKDGVDDLCVLAGQVLADGDDLAAVDEHVGVGQVAEMASMQ
jgi:hypothetical protein